MNRPAKPLYVPWRARLRPTPPRQPAAARPATPPPAARPGIATRWKPRDRVRAAGA